MPTIWTGSVPAREAGEKPPDGVRGPALRFGDLRATGASASGEHGEDISLLCVRSRAQGIGARRFVNVWHQGRHEAR
jgi:hypothetical protein